METIHFIIPGSAFRKILALVYVVFISIIAIALVIMIFKEVVT